MWKYPKEVRKTMNATANITPDIVSAAVARGLRAAEPGRGAPKLIARRIASTPRAVEAWLSEQAAPNAASLLRMMAEYETVCDEVLRLIGRTGSGGGLRPDQRAALADILRSLESN